MIFCTVGVTVLYALDQSTAGSASNHQTLLTPATDEYGRSVSRCGQFTSGERSKAPCWWERRQTCIYRTQKLDRTARGQTFCPDYLNTREDFVTVDRETVSSCPWSSICSSRSGCFLCGLRRAARGWPAVPRRASLQRGPPIQVNIKLIRVIFGHH